MTRRKRQAHDQAVDLLLQRRDDDDAALREAFELAERNKHNDGAERLRRFALERYT